MIFRFMLTHLSIFTRVYNYLEGSIYFHDTRARIEKNALDFFHVNIFFWRDTFS